MSRNKCCIPGCLNSYPKAPEGVTWHPFPKNQNVSKKWRVKIGKSAEVAKNALVCSDHFNQKDFKIWSQNQSRILSPSAVPSIFESRREEKTAEVNVSPGINILSAIPLDVWEKNIFAYLSLNDVITLCSVSKDLQRNVQSIKHAIDVSCYYPLDVNGLLNYALSARCSSINLNHCYWLKPSEILAIISKTNLQHLHIFECDVDAECIEAICHLQLTSLSITLTTEWLKYFEIHRNNTVRCLQQLQKLEIFYQHFSSEVIIEIYLNVLKHCEELEHLKVFQNIAYATRLDKRFYEKRSYDENEILPKATPVPKLKSLVINVEKGFKNEETVAMFVALIVKDKVIPLRNFDFGILSGYLYKKNVISDHPGIFLNTSTLSINCSDTNFDFWLNFQPVQNLICQKDYQAIAVENLNADGFQEFAKRMVSNSSKTLKEIRVKQYGLFQGHYTAFLDGLSHITVNCLQITVVDVSGYFLEFNYNYDNYLNNATVRKHKALLKDLTNLKNLEKLMISPCILHCKYYKSNGEKCAKAMPFWKVTSACEYLKEIGITCRPSIQFCVDVDSLKAVAFCAKLKVLHLAGFYFKCKDNARFALSNITQSCGQLQKLYECDVINLVVNGNILNKNMRSISINSNVKFNKAFLNNLSQCERLEKMIFNTITITDSEYNNLANVLRKLKYLSAIVVKQIHEPSSERVLKIAAHNRTQLPKGRRQIRGMFERLSQILKSIQNERPAFYYSLNSNNRFLYNIPEAHLD